MRVQPTPKGFAVVDSDGMILRTLDTFREADEWIAAATPRRNR